MSREAKTEKQNQEKFELINQDEILLTIIPNIAWKFKSIFTLEDIEDMITELQLFFLEQIENRKFNGKGKGYIIKAIENKSRDSFRKFKKNQVFNEISDGKAVFISDETDLLGTIVNQDLEEQAEKEINLFPDWKLFSEWRKQTVKQIVPTADGLKYFTYVKDKYKPVFPDDYKDKILLSDRFKTDSFQKKITEVWEKIGALRPFSVKHLFKDYLRKFAKECNGWDKVDFFTYMGAKERFCKNWKYNGWNHLGIYISEFRKETGIKAEYFYIEEIKRSINEVLNVKKEATLTEICSNLKLKHNHAKVCFYLEYLVNAQEVRYRYSEKVKTGVFTVLKE